jgi:hypothetical protein
MGVSSRKQTMTETQTELSWLQQEAQRLESNNTTERLESLQLKDGTLVTFIVDISKPFGDWNDGNGLAKKIIPVTHKGTKKNLWLNVKNPLYTQLVRKLVEGQSEFTVSTTGTQKDTKYTLVVQA